MASRTLEKQRERILTVLMAPFMSCGARLPVYVLFAAAFFPVGGQNVVFGLYPENGPENGPIRWGSRSAT